MPDNGTTAIAISDSRLRDELEAVCRPEAASLYVLGSGVPDVGAVLKLGAGVLIVDAPNFTRLATEEKRILKQGGVQVMLALAASSMQDPALHDSIVEAADIVTIPLDQQRFKIQLARAHELARLRGQAAATSETAEKDQRKFDAALAKRTGERNSAENEAFALERRLADLGRLKSNLITIISHEFKTPLHLASGYVALLGDSSLGDLNEEQRNAVQTVKRQLERLSGKIADIERIAQLEMGLPQELMEAVDLGIIIRNEVDGFAGGARTKGVRLNTRIENGLPLVYGCADFLSDVFRRLVDNAIHYNKEGGTVTITAARGRGTAGTPGIVASVADTGAGIPPALLPHIFERFGEFRDVEHHSSRRSGLGLGLAICRHLVELHEGAISVQSEQGKGSTFTVFLPESNRRQVSASSAPNRMV